MWNFTSESGQLCEFKKIAFFSSGQDNYSNNLKIFAEKSPLVYELGIIGYEFYELLVMDDELWIV